ncbi:MAG: glycine betaine/L-proline ABC transporter substrate-binding protein ProX [Dongiaceae bacterium]
MRMMTKPLACAALACTVLALLSLAGMLTAGAVQAEDVPGAGREVKLARPTWDTGWFQTEIYRKGLEALGYRVPAALTLDVSPFYQAVAQGDVDLWVDGWFPLHEPYRSSFEPGAGEVGYVAKAGALQGYLIDKKTADAYHIKTLDDLKKPEIAKLFDTDGDGKADMVACPPGWACELAIAHHFQVFGLGDYIKPVKASYSASMADAIARFKEGKPILYYTWTPNWTAALLKPGRDVVWLEVPAKAIPGQTLTDEDKAIAPGIVGCVEEPCRMGFAPNDIRPVVNKVFLKDNPAVAKLLNEIAIPLPDIYAENAEMYNGENKQADIERHAQAWIDAHAADWAKWIAAAKAAR